MRTLQPWFVRIIVTVLAVTGAAVLFVGGQAQAGGGCRGMPVTERAGLTVDLEGACFSPTILHVAPGQTVTWLNDQSKATHTVTGANAAWGDYTEVAPGQSVSHQFATAGVYPYYCFIHPGMIGAIVVGDGGGSRGGKLVSVSAGAPPQTPGEARSTGGANTTNRLRLYVVIAAAVGIAAAAGGFVLGGRAARA